MGREHASREKKIPMVNFLIFVQKNVSTIRFQEIKIRPSHFGPKKFDRVGRGGQGRSKYGTFGSLQWEMCTNAFCQFFFSWYIFWSHVISKLPEFSEQCWLPLFRWYLVAGWQGWAPFEAGWCGINAQPRPNPPPLIPTLLWVIVHSSRSSRWGWGRVAKIEGDFLDNSFSRWFESFRQWDGSET